MTDIPIVGHVIDDIRKALGQATGTDESGRLAIQVVKIERLHCYTTEDSTGADEAELTIFAHDALAGVDALKTGLLSSIEQALGVLGDLLEPTAFSKAGQTFRQQINDDQDMTLGIYLPLLPGQSFAVRLVDEDSPDADDHLASVTVKLHAAKGFLSQTPHPLGVDIPVKNIALQGDDAVYELVCDVVDVTLVADSDVTDVIGDDGVVPPLVDDTLKTPGDILEGLGLGGLVGGKK